MYSGRPYPPLLISSCAVQDARPGVQKVAIVVTDGQSGDTQQTALEAKRAADDNITVFAVGKLTANVDMYSEQLSISTVQFSS